MSYLRAAGMTLMDKVRNEKVYSNFGMDDSAIQMNCGVVDCVKRSVRP